MHSCDSAEGSFPRPLTAEVWLRHRPVVDFEEIPIPGWECNSVTEYLAYTELWVRLLV